MAVSTTQLSVSYNGTGSTGPFPIPFPFLDASYIYASVAANSGATPVLLATSAYMVARNSDGSGGTLTLNNPIDTPQVLIIFRQTPLTQPTVFQPAGAFPAKANETGLDRLCMQVQELAQSLRALGAGSGDGGGGEGGIAPEAGASNGMLTWANAAARAATAGQFTGQLGVEISTQTVWIAQSIAPGDWMQFDARFKNKLVIGYVADAGLANEQQALAVGLLEEWNVDYVIAAGDMSYDVPTGIYYGYGYGDISNYDEDWLAFQPWIDAGKLFPALGNHELDYDGWPARLAAKFPYIANQNGGRYYKVTLGGGLVDLFVLDSGVNSAGELIEPDGNTVDSAQHTWFVNALAGSTARWRIAMFHHPPVSLNQDPTKVLAAMAWPELAQMHLICCGHAHLLEILSWSDVLLANLSAVAYSDGYPDYPINGPSSSTDRPLWAHAYGSFGLGRILATEDMLEIQAWSTKGQLLHTRDCTNLGKLREYREKFMVVPPMDEVGTGGTYFVTRLVEDTFIRQVSVSALQLGGELGWSLTYGPVQTIAVGALGVPDQPTSYMETVDCSAPANLSALLNAGNVIEFQLDSGSPSSKGIEITLYCETYK
jgi:hypothetical protein